MHAKMKELWLDSDFGMCHFAVPNRIKSVWAVSDYIGQPAAKVYGFSIIRNKTFVLLSHSLSFGKNLDGGKIDSLSDRIRGRFKLTTGMEAQNVTICVESSTAATTRNFACGHGLLFLCTPIFTSEVAAMAKVKVSSDVRKVEQAPWPFPFSLANPPSTDRKNRSRREPGTRGDSWKFRPAVLTARHSASAKKCQKRMGGANDEVGRKGGGGGCGKRGQGICAYRRRPHLACGLSSTAPKPSRPMLWSIFGQAHEVITNDYVGAISRGQWHEKYLARQAREALMEEIFEEVWPRKRTIVWPIL